LSQSSTITDQMDPELLPAFAALPENDPSITDPERTRRMMAEGRFVEGGWPARDPNVARRDATAPGTASDPGVPLRVYEPDGREGVLPAILYIHGGGFIAGALDDFDRECERLALAVDAVVVSVDYRLSPEHTFPAATDDCHAALRWLLGSADELAVDPSRVAAVGPSAGGGLVAALALIARDRELELAFQMPLCACLDDRVVTPSTQDATDRRTVTREFLVRMWEVYLGPGAGEVSPYAAPARAEDLVGLPPTYMMVGGLDPFRDENIEYAARLAQAGVPTEFHLYPGAFHGFDTMVRSASVSREAVASQERALRRALHSSVVV
jgi:acetyl esterase/lipase